MEQDSKETTGVTRGQNVLYVLPHDRGAMMRVLGPVIEKLDPASDEVQLIAVTPDAETAVALASVAVRLGTGRGIRAVAATGPGRAGRVLRAGHVQLVAGAPAELLALVQRAALKLENARSLLLAWVDELPPEGGQALEAFLGDFPKGAARTMVVASLGTAAESLAERYAWRARRVLPGEGQAAPTPLSIVTTGESARGATLRRVLDALDPEKAGIFTRTDDGREEAAAVLAALGYGGTEAPVRLIGPAEAGPGDIVVLYDLPESAAELRQAVSESRARVVALATPRQLASVRALASGGGVSPLVLPESATRARNHDAALRDELRGELALGAHSRELLALEPLLEEWDGVEIAAALLRILERERASRPAVSAGDAPKMGKLFVNLGTKDRARASDLVGALANELGIAREQIGKIDMRETFTLMEIGEAIAEEVAQRLSGITIKGRRIAARLDQERGERPEREERGPRGPGGPRPDRGSDRGERPRRSFADRPRREGDDRPPRRPRAEGPGDDRPRAPRPRRDRE
ncbi:MAG: DbpA RNA binding domain-containing protein [Gemmatimonadaceae bacterium]